jgi:hypothetical protein
MSDDPVLEKLNEMNKRLDAQLLRLDELERLLARYFELTRMITGVSPLSPPSPPPSVN